MSAGTFVAISILVDMLGDYDLTNCPHVIDIGDETLFKLSTVLDIDCFQDNWDFGNVRWLLAQLQC